MDLREIRAKITRRHPWETARLRALRAILQSRAAIASPKAVLDIGCGDGFTVAELFRPGNGSDHLWVDAVDIHLSPAKIVGCASRYPWVRFHNTLHSLAGRRYDLLLLLDVLEHVEHDTAFLETIAHDHAAPGAAVLLTVPAFQGLFSRHDEFLGHLRRYDRPQVVRLVRKAGLSCLGSGYLFFTLLPLRFLAVCWQRLVRRRGRATPGVGGWQGGPLVTKGVELLLRLDNRALLLLNRFGVRPWGLTVWALCEKQ